MEFEEIGNKIRNFGKKVLRSRAVRKTFIIFALFIFFFVILVGALKIIFLKDTAGNGKEKAAVPNHASNIMQSAGISSYVGSGKNSSSKTITSNDELGDGFSSTTEVAGKKYRNYKQYEGSYSGNHFWDGNIASDGCGPTCVAIVLSGYGLDYNPGDVVDIMQSHGHDESTSFSYLTQVLNEKGISTDEKYIEGGNQDDLTRIRANFDAGRPIIVNAPGHYVVYLGEDSGGNLIISDPGRADGWNDRYGATLEDLIANGGSGISCGYILITSDKNSSSSSNSSNNSNNNSNSNSTSSSSSAQKIVESAQECHKYLRENGYTYDQAVLQIPDGIINSDGTPSSGKTIDCSAFVSWVYYCAGYESFKGYQETDIISNYESHGLKKLSVSEAQPGDILHEPGHIEIVAEVKNGTITKVYNCGSDNSIKDPGSSELPESTPDYGGADCVFRANDVAGEGHSINGVSSSSSSTNIYGHIVENGHGGYKIDIDLDAKIQEMIDNFEEEKDNPLRKYLSNTNRKEYLVNFMKAAMVTYYPDLRQKSEIGKDLPEGEIQGVIKVKRKTKDTDENSEGDLLQYISYEKYTELKNNKDNNIFNYFTIDSSGALVVAGYEKRTSEPQKVDYDGDPRPDEIEDESEPDLYNITDSKINYVQQIERYSMPFDLLWTLLVYSGEEDFVNDLSKLVLKSEIVLTVCDNITEKDTTDVYTYRKEVDSTEKIEFKNTFKTPYHPLEKKYSRNLPVKYYNYKITNKSHYETNTPSITVTYADSWAMKYEQKLKKTTSEDTNENEQKHENDTAFKDGGTDLINYKKDYDEFITQKTEDFEKDLKNAYKNDNITGSISYEISPIEIKYSNFNSNKKRTVTVVTKTLKYETQPGSTTGKIDPDDEDDNFVKLLKHNTGAKRTLKILREWFFESVELQESICDMEDLLKYLFQQVYNVNLGVEDFDFDEYGKEMRNFSSGDFSVEGNNFKEKVWNAFRSVGYSEYATAGAMANFEHESGFIANNLENIFNESMGITDEEYTRRVDSGEYTLEQFISDHTVANCGAGYGLAQWTWGDRKAGLYKYAKSKNVSIADEDMQIRYILGEISLSGGAEGYASYQGNENRGYTYNDWFYAESPEDAAVAFCGLFEGPATDYSIRTKAARDYYNTYGGKK